MYVCMYVVKLSGRRFMISGTESTLKVLTGPLGKDYSPTMRPYVRLRGTRTSLQDSPYILCGKNKHKTGSF